MKKIRIIIPCYNEEKRFPSRTDVLTIVKEPPFLLLRNALLNGFHRFSVGYINKAPFIINILSALAGLVFFLVLFIKRKFFWITAIGGTTIGFVLFNPSIQAYMCGAYALFFMAVYEVPRDMNKQAGKKRLLYVSTNDGSDTRINKEIKTLSEHFEIDFIGIGSPEKAFVKKYCKEFHLIQGSRKSLLSWLKIMILVNRLSFRRSYDSMHLINEQLLVLLYPLCFIQYNVVDLFDSFFLKTAHRGLHVELIRWILFLPVNKIIVTDDNRKLLMPLYLQKKVTVVENFPNAVSFVKETQTGKTIIFYTGWMGIRRGTELMQKLVDTYEDIELWMAGWFADDATERLAQNKKVKYWGVLPQIETMRIAAQADYILCLYAPIHDNNINASPNKIYDAIQVKTPVIINQEIMVSGFVKEHNLGIVIPEFDCKNLMAFHDELVSKKGQFNFSESIKEKFCWEKIEYKLINCHQ
jgi:hypothetical protein